MHDPLREQPRGGRDVPSPPTSSNPSSSFRRISTTRTRTTNNVMLCNTQYNSSSATYDDGRCLAPQQVAMVKPLWNTQTAATHTFGFDWRPLRESGRKEASFKLKLQKTMPEYFKESQNWVGWITLKHEIPIAISLTFKWKSGKQWHNEIWGVLSFYIYLLDLFLFYRWIFEISFKNSPFKW